jgi:hypothetical protein
MKYLKLSSCSKQEILLFSFLVRGVLSYVTSLATALEEAFLIINFTVRYQSFGLPTHSLLLTLPVNLSSSRLGNNLGLGVARS